MPAAIGISSIAIDDSIESLLGEQQTGSRAISLAMILMVIVALLAAAMIRVDVTVRAAATLSSAIDRQTLRTNADGRVARIAIANGAKITEGDTLLVLDSPVSDRAIETTRHALDEEETLSADLHSLITMPLGERYTEPRLAQARSQSALRAASAEWRQQTIEVQRAERAHERLTQLAQRGFAVPAEFESADFDLARAREARALALERRRAQWSLELAESARHIHELQRDRVAHATDRSARVVIAPVSGTAEDVAPLTVGSVVRPGDAVAVISPDGALIADAYVAPRDVAQLRVGMPARLLVEGYDVQEWGGADAVVTTVASDYTLADGRPVFRVRARLVRATLQRGDGRTVALTKGLRGQLRFLLARPKLSDLVRRRGGEWLDPATPDIR